MQGITEDMGNMKLKTPKEEHTEPTEGIKKEIKEESLGESSTPAGIAKNGGEKKGAQPLTPGSSSTPVVGKKTGTPVNENKGGKRGRPSGDPLDDNVPEDFQERLAYLIAANYFQLDIYISKHNDKDVLLYKCREEDGIPKAQWCGQVEVKPKDDATGKKEAKKTWTTKDDKPTKENPVTFVFMKNDAKKPVAGDIYYAKCSGSRKVSSKKDKPNTGMAKGEEQGLSAVAGSGDTDSPSDDGQKVCKKSNITIYFMGEHGAYTAFDPSLGHSEHILHTFDKQIAARNKAKKIYDSQNSLNRETVEKAKERMEKTIKSVAANVKVIAEEKKYSVSEAIDLMEKQCIAKIGSNDMFAASSPQP